ncbi:MAG: response regulator transcription factor [Clostridiales bacterium]|nr:response regulator transcription factor [Clostridiales bacterium]MDD7309304.1 response regulator transcription factor [Eubacteriales bacterium]MDY5347883.1 response regulator transcription factor [Eubacteriales bacterium]
MKILIVDDEKLLVKGIKFNLENDGYDVDAVYNGEDALALAQENEYDLIVLDLMLPKMDGLEVCRRIREFSKVPVVMLTAKGEDTDKLLGFEYGADDYISKPFNVLELKARIRAILRRSASRNTKSENETRVDGGAIVLELSERLAYVGERPVDLTPKEFDLLELLMRSPNCVFSRESLLNTVWGYDYPGDIRTVDVHIRRLREKLEDNPAEPEHILTKWGIGYYYKV